MADRWFCLIDGQKIGPVKFSRLKQLAEAGRLRAHDYVRPEDQAQWSSAHEIADLIPAPVVTPETSESQQTAEPIAEKRRNSGSLPVATVLIQDKVTASAPPVRKGTPVGKAASPPVGKPVSPSKESGLASEFPLFITKNEPAHAAASGEASPAHPRKPKKSSVMPLMIGGGVAVGVLGLVLILVLSGVIDLSGSSEEVAATPAKKPKPAVETPAEDEGEEANPTEGQSQDAKAADKPAKKGDGKHSLLKTVKQFNDMSKIASIGVKGGMSVGLSGLWLSATESGAPVSGEETPKFLVVKVKIDNPAGAAAVDYKGWGDEAVLFDADDKAIEPLPAEKTPDQVVQKKIAPGSMLIDTLVFPLQSTEFDSLRLALPRTTVGMKGPDSFGMELPRRALGRGLDTQVAGAADPAISARKTAGEEEEEIVEKPAVANSTPKPEKPAAKPKDDDEEIIRKLEEKARLLDKMDNDKPKK